MDAEHSHGRGLLARNSLFNLVGQILPLFIGFFSIPYVVKGLGAEGFGILSIAWTLLGTFSMLDLGLGRATTKSVAECMNPEKAHRLPGLVWTSIALQTGLGIAGGLLIAAFVPLLVDHLFKISPGWTGEAKTSLFILAAAVPILLLANGVRGILEAAQRFDLVNYIKVPTSFSFYLIAALGIPLHWRVSTIILVSVFIRLVSAGVFLFFGMRVFPQLRTQWSFSTRELRGLFSFGGWVMVTNLTGPIFGYLERFAIASILSVSMLSYYVVPFELISKIFIFPSSIAPVLFPYFSREGNARTAAISDVSARTLKYLVFLMTPIVVIVFVFAREILTAWMGPDFAARSASTLQWVTLASFLGSFAYIPFTSVQALGRPDLKAIQDIIALPCYVAYSWPLMKHFGIPGAGAAKLVCTVIDCVLLFSFASWLKAFSLRSWVRGPLARAVLISFGYAVSVFAIKLLIADLLVVAVLVLVSSLLYVVGLWAAALGQEERSTLRRAVKSFGQRVSVAPLQEVQE